MLPLVAAFLIVAAALPSAAYGQSGQESLDIPYETFTLENGLTVVVSEDHRAPLVNVRVWYHVGAQEGPHAHLFEHVLFGKTEHTDRAHFDVLSEIGLSILEEYQNRQFFRQDTRGIAGAALSGGRLHERIRSRRNDTGR